MAGHVWVLLARVRRPAGVRGFVLLARRWAVARTMAWEAPYRGLSKNYAARPATSAALLDSAMTRLLLRRLAA